MPEPANEPPFICDPETDRLTVCNGDVDCPATDHRRWCPADRPSR